MHSLSPILVLLLVVLATTYTPSDKERTAMVNLHLAKREAVNPPASDMKYVVSPFRLNQLRIRNKIALITVASICTVDVLPSNAEVENNYQ